MLEQASPQNSSEQGDHTPNDETFRSGSNPGIPILITCALIDQDNIYQGMVAVEQSQVTDRHLIHINRCDLPIGQHQWCSTNETFKSIKTNRVFIRMARDSIIDGISILQKNKVEIPGEVHAWLQTLNSLV